MDFEKEIASLTDTLVVMAALERHHAEVQKLQAQELDAMREQIMIMREGMTIHDKRMAHIEQNLEEASDKLNGLIGFMDDFTRGKRDG